MLNDDSRMTGWLNEVEARVYTVVHDLLPIDTVFLFEICVITRFDVLYDRFPTCNVFSA
jgi:hypothetical protein